MVGGMQRDAIGRDGESIQDDAGSCWPWLWSSHFDDGLSGGLQSRPVVSGHAEVAVALLTGGRDDGALSKLAGHRQRQRDLSAGTYRPASTNGKHTAQQRLRSAATASGVLRSSRKRGVVTLGGGSRRALGTSAPPRGDGPWWLPRRRQSGCAVRRLRQAVVGAVVLVDRVAKEDAAAQCGADHC